MVKLRYQHHSTSVQTHRAREDTAADSAFQSGLLMPPDTASFLRPFGYGITCLLVSSCLLPLRCSCPDWQVSHWRGGQIRSILFLSALLHVFICYWSVVSVTSCTSAMYDITHKRICTLQKEEEDLILLNKWVISMYWISFYKILQELDFARCTCLSRFNFAVN